MRDKREIVALLASTHVERRRVSPTFLQWKILIKLAPLLDSYQEIQEKAIRHLNAGREAEVGRKGQSLRSTLHYLYLRYSRQPAVAGGFDPLDAGAIQRLGPVKGGTHFGVARRRH